MGESCWGRGRGAGQPGMHTGWRTGVLGDSESEQGET
jgi:hypothetical protein